MYNKIENKVFFIYQTQNKRRKKTQIICIVLVKL
jgi:hypothetical protein